MKTYFASLLLLLTCRFTAFASEQTIIQPLDGEYWWGGAVGIGEKAPYVKPLKEFNLATQNANNQVVPLLLSNKGRFVWSDKPFRFAVAETGVITITSDYEKVEIVQSGSTLRDACLAAAAKHFPPSGQLPDTLFFTHPQYNTWIELMYNQNEADILKYARSAIEAGFPPGILMIDDNWQKYYGNFEFKPDKFPAPKAMVEELHRLGFRVMLWVCPYVSPDSPEYRFLANKGYLLRRKDGSPAILRWWNGQSACYDLTNPEAAAYLISQLKEVQNVYGIDGYKFDAGDNSAYNPSQIVSYMKDALSVDHTVSWMKIGLAFPFNEYRAGWAFGGQALVARLGDKNYSWGAVQSLIPQMTAAGLLGYAYACPDMIGGGQFTSFLNIDAAKFDQPLIVRSAQVHALMPMMQFSVAPWRILNAENLAIVRQTALLHQRFAPYIMQCARQASMTGEPIVRCMEYAFPNEDFALCNDQFMLGEKYLVAPVVTQGVSRTVKLPKGRWKDDLGKPHKGGRTITIDAPLNRLPYFEKM